MGEENGVKSLSLTFAKNLGGIHKKVGVFECGFRIVDCGINTKQMDELLVKLLSP